MIPTFRTAGTPSPLLAGTHDDADLRATIPFEGKAADDLRAAAVQLEGAAGRPSPAADWDALDEGDLMEPDAVGLPDWLTGASRMIRPICVGALLAIPTLGAATVGTVAIFSGEAADRAVRASTAFLAGIPAEIVVLIGTLASGYSLSKTMERLRGVRR